MISINQGEAMNIWEFAMKHTLGGFKPKYVVALLKDTLDKILLDRPKNLEKS